MKVKIGIFLLLITLLWGCDKGSFGVDPIVDPIVNPPKVYTATLIIKGVGEEKTEVTSNLKSGDIKSFGVVQYPGYSRVSVVINGVVQPLPLSDVYDVKIISSDVKIEFGYLENRVIALTQASLYLKKLEQQETQTGLGIWVPMTPDQNYILFYRIFTVDGIYRMYDGKNILVGGPFQWHFTTGGGLIVGTQEYGSITFNADGTIVLLYVNPVLGSPGKTVNMRETWGATQGPS